MKATARLVLLGGIVGALVSSTAPASAQSYSVIKSFGVLTNVTGINPFSRLAQGPEGTLYGTLPVGEGAARGSVFRIQPDGSGFKVLKLFTNYNEGADPYGGLVVSGGTLYGTTSAGGSNTYAYGTVFKLGTNGTGFTVLKNFTYYDGATPYASLLLDGDTLYGTTRFGGSNYGVGTVFRLDTNGANFSVLRHLSYYTDGGYPTAGLSLSGGMLFGAASDGGASYLGTVFKLGTNGAGFTMLKNFTGADGQNPYATPVVVGDSLFGTTIQGGSSSSGTIYRMDTNGGAFTVLRHCVYASGGGPRGELVPDGGALYGAASSGGSTGGGVIFRMLTNGNSYTTLKNLSTADGATPLGVIRDGATLHGIANRGGASLVGALFKLGTNGAGFVTTKSFSYSDAVYPASGVVSAGANLCGTTLYGAAGQGALYRVGTNGTGYTTLINFNQTNGAYPLGEMLAVGNMLYGATSSGGSGKYGTLYRINADGTGYKALKNYTYANGSSPNGSLITSGNLLFGTTRYGGSGGGGTVFKCTTNGTGYIVLKNFPTAAYSGATYSYTNTQGAYPYSGLVLSGTTLYGTTLYGGTAGYGVVFKVNTNGTGFAVLKTFTLADVQYPLGGIALAGNTLFGTTLQANDSYYGTIFKLNTDGSGFGRVRTFTYYDGSYPQAGLLAVGDTLYGSTAYGGTNYNGTLFRVNTNGADFATLKHFSNVDADGMIPVGRTLLTNGLLYGTANRGGAFGDGTVFRVTLAPAIVTPPANLTVTNGFPANFSVVASGDAPLCYQWLKGAAPLAGQTNASYSIAGVTTNDAGNYSVVVSNNFGTVTSAAATLTVAPGAPAILTQPQSATNLAGTPVNFSVVASGSAPLSYQWWKDAASLTNQTNATLSFASVTVGDAGGYFVIVTNNLGSVTSAVANLAIGCPAIALLPTTLPNGAVNTPYNQPLAASNGTAPYSFNVTAGALPGGLNLSGGGVLSGTPTNNGLFNFTVTATDSNLCTGSRAYSLTVACPPIVVAPELLPNASIGAAYNQTNSASGGTAPYSFALTSGALPGGMSFAGGAFSGTPTNAGDFNFTITATDANGCTGNRSYAVSVSCPTIAIGPATLVHGYSDTAYEQALSVSGGSAPYTFSLASGVLPAGWSLATNGVISGTTTNVGDFNVTISATDVNGCAGSQAFTLTVDDVQIPATMTWIATVDADWDEPDNWSPQQVPGFLDTAIINTGVDVFIGPDITVSNLNLSNPSARLVGNSLTVLGTMNWPSGMVSNSVTIASNATAIWTGGDLEAQFTVAPGGTLYISNIVTFAVNNWNYSLTNDRVVLTNLGTVRWSSAFYGYGRAQIYNAGLWDNTGNFTMNDFAGTNRFINTGTFRKSGGTTATVQWHLNTIGNMEVTNAPIVITDWFGTNIINGTLNLSGGSMDAPLSIATNGQLNWTGGSLDSLMTVDPGGTLAISNVVGLAYDNYNFSKTNFVALTNNGTVRWSADLYGYGRAHIMNNSLWDDTGNFTMNNFSGTNLFINTGTFRKSGGTTANLQWFFGTTGLMDVTNGTLSIAKWTNNSVLNGTLNLSGGSMSAPLNIASNALLNWIGGNLDSLMTVDPGGLLVISNVVGLAYDNYNLGKTNFVALTNNGTVRWSADLYGYGRAHIINNSLWDDTGNFTMNSFTGTNVFINTGTFRKSGGTGVASLNWFFGTTGLMDVTNGSLSIAKWTNNSILNGTLNLSGGNITAPLALASNSFLNWTGGSLDSLMTANPGSALTINGAGLAYNNYNLGQTNFVALTNYSTVNLAGDCTGYGRAVIYNAGLWQDAGNHTVQQFSGSNTFVNVGTLEKTGGVGTSGIEWIFTQAGQFDVLSGNFSLGGVASQTNGTTTLNGGKLTVTQPFALLGGTLMGSTNITGSLTNSATVSPGLSPGQLTVTSAYTQTSNGVLQIELGGYAMGTNSDKLVVSGAANLDGAVNFSLINSFVPTNGSSFTFLTCASRTGTFTNFSLPPQLSGMLSNAATFVMLRITNVQAVITAPVVVFGPLVTNGDFVARFLGTPGTTYTIERTAPLVPVNWQKLTNLLAPPTDLGIGVGVFELRDPVSPTTNRFYRTVHPPY